MPDVKLTFAANVTVPPIVPLCSRKQGDSGALLPVSGGWEGLPRQIIMWMDMEPKTPRVLFNHLERSGFEVPQWMRDEAEMQNLDHVPSKGTRAVFVFKAYCESLAEEIQ